MSIYLVDYENVNADGLKDVGRLGSDDRVIVFYTANADKITFELHNRLNESAADISFLKVDAGGKNALDFQLSTYLGYLTAVYKEERFFIVSKDTGFNYIVNFWRERKVRVQRIPSLVNAPKSPEVKAAEKSAVLMLEAPQQTEENSEAQTEKDSQPDTAPAADAPVPAPDAAKPAAESKPKAQQTDVSGEQKNNQAPAAANTPKLSELIPDKTECNFVQSTINKYKTKQGINNALQKKFGNTRTSEIYKLIQPFIKDKKGR